MLEALLLFALPLLFTLQKLEELPELGVSSHQLLRLFYTAIDPMAVNGDNDDSLSLLPVRPSRLNHSGQAPQAVHWVCRWPAVPDTGHPRSAGMLSV